MNYLAHGFRHVADPWVVAGTALPDWLRVLDRRARLHAETLERRRLDADPRVASLVRGVLRHHEDDRRFHGSSAFGDTRRDVADALRGVLPEADGHRPSFVAHLVVEVQLDAAIVAMDRSHLTAYYAAIESLDAGEVEAVVRGVAPDVPGGLAGLVRRFLADRFLAEYADPAAVVRRLDRVVRRVRQPGLPPAMRDVLPVTQGRVDLRRDELLG